MENLKQADQKVYLKDLEDKMLEISDVLRKIGVNISSTYNVSVWQGLEAFVDSVTVELKFVNKGENNAN